MQPRWRERIPVGYSARIQSDIGTGEAILLDLSPTGCRMRSAIDVQAGSYLTLQIAVAADRAPLGVEVSVVRWCRDGQFGVEFLRYRHGDRERVTQLLDTLPSHHEINQPENEDATLIAVGA